MVKNILTSKFIPKFKGCILEYKAEALTAHSVTNEQSYSQHKS